MVKLVSSFLRAQIIKSILQHFCLPPPFQNIAATSHTWSKAESAVQELTLSILTGFSIEASRCGWDG
jgi:hypothetical protein